MSMSKSRAYIRAQGMGGFLNPPTHPEHTQSVESSRRDEFSMSLSSAISCDWLEDGVREHAKTILANWQRPAIESPEVQEWILQVLGYFRNCYRGDGPEPECWNASNLHIVKGDEARPSEQHAGVHLIRKYYPEYQPTREQFHMAYWGTKPDKVTA